MKEENKKIETNERKKFKQIINNGAKAYLFFARTSVFDTVQKSERLSFSLITVVVVIVCCVKYNKY